MVDTNNNPETTQPSRADRMKTYMLKREGELCNAVQQLSEQYTWCKEHGANDLAHAYLAGERALLDELSILHKMMKELHKIQ